MAAPTISLGTPPEQVARFAKEANEIVVEGDDAFQQLTLDAIRTSPIAPGATPARAAAPRGWRLLRHPWLVVAVICGAGVVASLAVWLSQSVSHAPPALAPAPAPAPAVPQAPPSSVLPPPVPPSPVPPDSSAALLPNPSAPVPRGDVIDHDMVATLAWPVVVTFIAVLAYLVIRQAIAGGNTVEVSWKVTEKAQGRLVVRKVVERRHA
jgi:hypothetical protein